MYFCVYVCKIINNIYMKSLNINNNINKFFLFSAVENKILILVHS